MSSRGAVISRRAMSIACLAALAGSAVAQTPADSPIPADAGTPDAGIPDAGTPDAGALDAGATVSDAPPLAHDAAAPAPYEETDCDTGIYLEPGVVGFVGGGAQLVYGLSFRFAGGVVLRLCDADRRGATRMRVGVSYYVAAQQGHLYESDDPHGGGAEIEVDRSITPLFRLGGRLGFEYGGGPIVQAGPRLHIGDLVYVGLEGYWAAARLRAPVAPMQGGAMFGAGFEGKIGRSAGYWILGVGLGLGLLVLAAGLSAS